MTPSKRSPFSILGLDCHFKYILFTMLDLYLCMLVR